MFLSESPTSVHLHSLMWQPTCECSSHCEGCYLNCTKETLSQRSFSQQLGFLSELESGAITSDELILSLNYGPAENAILNRLLWNKSCGLIDTQLALTVNTVNVFFRQDYSVYPSRQTTLFPYLTRIMTSALYTDWPFDCPVDKLLFALRDLANFSNTYDTYSIVSKSPLGHDQWNSYYGANKILFGAKSRLAIQPQLSSHMYIDRCLIAAYRYLRKGIACNGGINSVHLWPSGKITACPYDTDGLTMVDGDTVAQQIRNMHQAPSPITHCHLPDLLDKVLRDKPSYEEVLKQYEYQ